MEKTDKAPNASESLQKVTVFRYESTDSTNNRAREYAESGTARFPAVFVAREQSAGRGRLGRSFDSAKDAGIYISFLVKPDTAATEAVKITVAAAVKVCRVIERLCGLNVGIKWVNDIFVNGKKLAGILTEAKTDSQTGKIAYFVCGIGINVKKRIFPGELSEIATTVENEGGTAPKNEVITDALIEEFFLEEDKTALMNEYKERSLVMNRTVSVKTFSGESYTARAVDITDNGGLLVLRDGVVSELFSGEVSIRL